MQEIKMLGLCYRKQVIINVRTGMFLPGVGGFMRNLGIW